jgi:hypothetical protein
MGWTKGSGQKVFRIGQQSAQRPKEKALSTTFSNKANILSELWLEYRDEEQFLDFVAFNDLGLPLAYAIANGIVEASPTASEFIDETFRLLLSELEIEDTGFESLDDVLDASSE